MPNIEEFIEYVSKTDLSRVIALDVSTHSTSFNKTIYGRVQDVKDSLITVCTGKEYQYDLQIFIPSNRKLELLLIEEGKKGFEYISKQISFYTEEPCTNLIKLIMDKILKDGGTIRKAFPTKKLAKCLVEDTMYVMNSVINTAETGFDEYGIYGDMCGMGMYTGYVQKKDKEFYFKEYKGKAVISK